MQFEEQKFIQLIDNIPNVAVQGYNKEREVIFWNNASEVVYGYTKEEALGKRLEDLIIPDAMCDWAVTAIEAWYKEGVKIPSGELPLKHKDGSTVYVYSSHVMLSDENGEAEMYCIDVDLTKQKKQEQLLFDQSKRAAMGTMIDAIAHQWKQPLSSIMSAVSRLHFQAMKGNGATKKEVRECTDTVSKVMTHLTTTINEFSTFFRPIDKRVDVEVRELVDSSLNLLHNDLVNNEIEVEIIGESDVSANVVINEFKHVLLNLIMNAKDAFVEHGIEERKIVIDITKDGDKCILKVSDNAGGIPEEIIHNIFDANFTTKEEGIGSGIGLYITKQIIDKLGAKISAQNMHDGVLFTIEI